MSLFNISFVFDWNLKNKYNKLIKYHLESDYWKPLVGKNNRNSNITLVGPINNTGLFAKETPSRIGFDNTLNRKLKPSCPLCVNINHPDLADPINKIKCLLWRGYIICPNTFPYFKNHYLIISSNHNENRNGVGTQKIIYQNKLVIYDMLKFYQLNNYSGTMFFNGEIGNSLNHFHFHHISEELPIKKYIEMNHEVKVENYSKNGIDISIFKNLKKSCLNGIVFSGSLDDLSKTIFSFLEGIKSKFKFNLVFYLGSDKRIKVILFIRKYSKKLKYYINVVGLSGIFTKNKISLEDLKSGKIAEQLNFICQESIEIPTKKLLTDLKLI